MQWGVAADENNLYVAVSDPKFQPVGPATPGAQMSWFRRLVNPLIAKRAEDFGPLNSKPGKRSGGPRIPVAATCRDAVPRNQLRLPRIPGLVFSGGLDGHLRAYSTADGKIVWDMDTRGDYRTVNGVAAKGGSLDGGGAVIVDGIVYVGSGSGFVGTMPGNVLLAY